MRTMATFPGSATVLSRRCTAKVDTVASVGVSPTETFLSFFPIFWEAANAPQAISVATRRRTFLFFDQFIKNIVLWIVPCFAQGFFRKPQPIVTLTVLRSHKKRLPFFCGIRNP